MTVSERIDAALLIAAGLVALAVVASELCRPVSWWSGAASAGQVRRMAQR